MLAFVARRLSSDPILLLAAVREGFGTPFEDAGLPELRLERLDDAAASALLDARAPGLAPAMRERVLADAAGNPLALVELPLASARARRRGAAPGLAAADHAARAGVRRARRRAAHATRTLLLVAALDDGGVPAEILAAAALVCPGGPGLEDLTPAVEAQLVDLDAPRAALPPSARALRDPPGRERLAAARDAHAALAAGAGGAAAPARVAPRGVGGRHRRGVAAELEATAGYAQQRGGGLAAICGARARGAPQRRDRARRAGRLLRAAELAFELGRADLVARLLRRGRGAAARAAGPRAR